MKDAPIASVRLGFAEPPEEPLTPDTFPSKIGGKPAWLNPEHVLEVDRVRCGVCDKPMSFLLQLYTPEDEPAEAYHRMVYMFCCRNGACLKKEWQKCVKVFRSQLPRLNPYWSDNESSSSNARSSEDSEDDVDEEEEEECKPRRRAKFSNPAKTCVVCGLRGGKTCSKCHTASYCSRDHQLYHWSTAMHRQLCGKSEGEMLERERALEEKLLAKSTFPEFEIVDEEEDSNRKLDEYGNLVQELDGVQITEEANADEAGEGESKALVPVGDEAYEETEVDVDKAFLKFQKRIQTYPDQILRYARVEYQLPLPDPLWASDSGRPDIERDIGRCAHCGGERTFEFQVMPQLLTFLGIDHSHTDALDFGTLIVYSCKDNCHAPHQPLVEEAVWLQNFSEDGMKLGKDA
ncbi:uncharacterized protein VTP21DRAFT_1982 [Calcarisporiella thermophila]|uniref:uncharacterized protein n=1 Tax=Calcarisporiella thermophila TaxID=911321 RepID=UPI0037440798